MSGEVRHNEFTDLLSPASWLTCTCHGRRLSTAEALRRHHKEEVRATGDSGLYNRIIAERIRESKDELGKREARERQQMMLEGDIGAMLAATDDDYLAIAEHLAVPAEEGQFWSFVKRFAVFIVVANVIIWLAIGLHHLNH